MDYSSIQINGVDLNSIGEDLVEKLSSIPVTYIYIASGIVLALSIFYLICFIKLYKNLGLGGWEWLIPIYGQVVLFKAVGMSGWNVLWLFVPIVGIVFFIILLAKISKKLGHSGAFVIGLLFLPIIFFVILSFSKQKDSADEEVSEVENLDLYCPKCGVKLPTNSKACYACGTEINGVLNESVNSAIPTQQVNTQDNSNTAVVAESFNLGEEPALNASNNLDVPSQSQPDSNEIFNISSDNNINEDVNINNVALNLNDMPANNVNESVDISASNINSEINNGVNQDINNIMPNLSSNAINEVNQNINSSVSDINNNINNSNEFIVENVSGSDNLNSANTNDIDQIFDFSYDDSSANTTYQPVNNGLENQNIVNTDTVNITNNIDAIRNDDMPQTNTTNSNVDNSAEVLNFDSTLNQSSEPVLNFEPLDNNIANQNNINAGNVNINNMQNVTNYKKCPICGSRVVENADKCFICGSKLN